MTFSLAAQQDTPAPHYELRDFSKIHNAAPTLFPMMALCLVFCSLSRSNKAHA